ncbi:hypothetical protein [Nonomuraea sp. NPDC049709]|uniref:hypothetical protein n=1 Tax=Nonomuraea sp. NPDC049709 TaxID=3154736 RepID=UPI0034406A70
MDYLAKSKAGRGAEETLAVARRAAETRTRLDPLHRAALGVALAPVCRIRDR